jgi:hypothetical protein
MSWKTKEGVDKSQPRVADDYIEHHPACEFRGNWPWFTCPHCQQHSLGGDEAYVGAEDKKLYFICATRWCRSLYTVEFKIEEVGLEERAAALAAEANAKGDEGERQGSEQEVQ